MDRNTEQGSALEQEHTPYPSYAQAMRTIKTEPMTFWETEARPFVPMHSMLDSQYCTYTPLETYSPESQQNSPTYLNLTSSSMYSTTSSSIYLTPPSLQEDMLLSHNYNYNTNLNSKLDNLHIFSSDDGLGGSPSSINTLSPPGAGNCQVLSPAHSSNQASPSGGNVADSDFADNSLSPPPALAYDRECVQCGIRSSTQWHPAIDNHVLCYRCYQKTYEARAPASDIVEEPRKKKKNTLSRRAQMCSNCGSEVTSLWRRNASGEFVCNACGLYEKLHKKSRPISMRKNVIQRRKRNSKKEAVAKKRSSAPKPVPALPPARIEPALPSYTPNIDDIMRPPPYPGIVSLPPMNSNVYYTQEPNYQILQSMLNYPNETGPSH